MTAVGAITASMSHRVRSGFVMNKNVGIVAEMIRREVERESLMRVYRDGNERGWANEFNYLEAEHTDRIIELEASVRESGIHDPIILGSDGRVWDGHHRLCVAERLGMKTVPVWFAGEHERESAGQDDA